VDPLSSPITRRDLLRGGGGLALGAALGAGLDLSPAATAARLRRPDSLPDPLRPAGEPDPSLPFDHVVVVMQENHSFDAYLGMLSRRGQPRADGLTFNRDGVPINSNPYGSGYVVVQHVPSDCTLQGSASQSWRETHIEIDGGRMDGFAALGVDSMAYWDESEIPFYYSMAKTFCLANRWFCSAPCQTYPNRRFLQAGTAFGLISTDTSSVTQYPPNGTIWDRLHSLSIPWANYFTDVPTSAIIFDTIEKYPTNMVPIERFYADCAAGTLPAVSMVDSGIGAADDLAGLAGLDYPPGVRKGAQPGEIDQDEEDGNVSEGENFVSHVVNAVLRSPLWPRILLIWCYDEHGGDYDHVPPPRAIPPDNIAPKLGSDDPPGGYNMYGPRVPAVVVSGYARPRSVTNVVHDHTSILATIEAKWNVPALTHRDANAATLKDFLTTKPTFPEPPKLAAPSGEAGTQAKCDPGPLEYTVYRKPPRHNSTFPVPKLRLTIDHHRHARNTVIVGLRCVGGHLTDLVVELEHGKRVLARGHVHSLGEKVEHVHLHHGHLKAGRYTIRVRQRKRTLLVRHEHLNRREV
jgi:phospholipase C